MTCLAELAKLAADLRGDRRMRKTITQVFRFPSSALIRGLQLFYLVFCCETVVDKFEPPLGVDKAAAPGLPFFRQPFSLDLF